MAEAHLDRDHQRRRSVALAVAFAGALVAAFAWRRIERGLA